ncbi:hypothetical protein L3V83_05265 [Thiotrichales bacterium 19X7-9]|nr:hypothetical protein [Thiotrichales bacterium 19X7-9]
MTDAKEQVKKLMDKKLISADDGIQFLKVKKLIASYSFNDKQIEDVISGSVKGGANIESIYMYAPILQQFNYSNNQIIQAVLSNGPEQLRKELDNISHLRLFYHDDNIRKMLEGELLGTKVIQAAVDYTNINIRGKNIDHILLMKQNLVRGYNEIQLLKANQLIASYGFNDKQIEGIISDSVKGDANIDSIFIYAPILQQFNYSNNQIIQAVSSNGPEQLQKELDNASHLLLFFHENNIRKMLEDELLGTKVIQAAVDYMKRNIRCKNRNNILAMQQIMEQDPDRCIAIFKSIVEQSSVNNTQGVIDLTNSSDEIEQKKVGSKRQRTTTTDATTDVTEGNKKQRTATTDITTEDEFNFDQDEFNFDPSEVLNISFEIDSNTKMQEALGIEETTTFQPFPPSPPSLFGHPSPPFGDEDLFCLDDNFEI